MTTPAFVVVVVVIPASAASLLVLALDVRSQRRRRPRWTPTSSRVTAALGAALGIAGFALTSLAGVAGAGHTARAAESHAELIWVATATATATGNAGQAVVPPAEGQADAQLPFAPLVIWGSGFDGVGGYTLLAEVPGGTDIPLLSGDWPAVTGEAPRSLALLDPAAIVDAARAHGILPAGGVLPLELRSNDPRASVHLTLADRPAAPVPAPAAAPPLSVRLPAAAVAPAAARAPVTGTVATPAPGTVGVPSTGAGASLLGGLALLLAGGACAGLSLRLHRRVPAAA